MKALPSLSYVINMAKPPCDYCAFQNSCPCLYRQEVMQTCPKFKEKPDIKCRHPSVHFMTDTAETGICEDCHELVTPRMPNEMAPRKFFMRVPA